MRGLAMALVVVLSGFRMALGVIVEGGDGTQNTTADGAGVGWDYVGSVGGASGVYLGGSNGAFWVLTAAHVGAGGFTLDGITYGMVADSAVTLSGNADLVLFRIDGNPGLAALEIAASTPEAGTPLTMIGYGIGRDAEPTRWSLGWTETTAPELGAYQGYKWSGEKVRRWGTNTVATSEGSGSLATENFSTQFGTGTAQATVGDSGGGVFLADGTLAGIMLAVDQFSSPLGTQPASTSIFSAPLGAANSTYMADLAAYRAEILDIMAMAPVPEPRTWALILLGGALCVVAMRSRR